MSKIIKHAELIEPAAEYIHRFDYADLPGCGFSFPCDEHGNLLGHYPNYQECLNGTITIREGMEWHRNSEGEWEPRENTGVLVKKQLHDLGIVKFQPKPYLSPAILKCDCGEEIYLDLFTNSCDCGRDYNRSGQLLSPRECWGEETGESLSEILNIR